MPVRIKKTPPTDRAGVILGGNGRDCETSLDAVPLLFVDALLAAWEASGELATEDVVFGIGDDVLSDGAAELMLALGAVVIVEEVSEDGRCVCDANDAEAAEPLAPPSVGKF